MATINLRPWREERKERLKNEFVMVAGLFAGLALTVIFAWHMVIANVVSSQQSRNTMLQTEISSLDKKIKEVNELKKRKEDLIERMKVIQGLQGHRPLIVHIFDSLAKTIPEGVFYTKMERKGSKVLIEGTAESNQRVSALMRNLDESDWFSSPNLTKVVANVAFGEQGNDFMMTVNITALQEEEERKRKEKAAASARKKRKGKK